MPSLDAHDPDPDQAGGETLIVYDHDTGRRLEVERVEDEYVEIWEHGKWVKGTSHHMAPLPSSPPPTNPTTSTTIKQVRIKSPYSRIRKKPAERDVNENNDFILLDEDVPKEGRVVIKEPPSVVPIVPINTSFVVRSSSDVIERLGPKGSDDFHFAQREILPTQPTAARDMPKLHNLDSFSVKTNIKSSTASTATASSDRHKTANVQPSSIVPMTGSTTKPVKMAVKTSRRYANPKSARLRHSLVEPRQLPLPKHSGSSRRSAPGGRRTKHSRAPYREPPHINVNAKAGARINYVNINKKTVNSPNVIINNRNISVDMSQLSHQPAQNPNPSYSSNNSNKTVSVVSKNIIPNFPQLKQSPPLTVPRPSPSGSIVHHYAETTRQAAPQDHFRSIDAQLDLQDGYGRHSFNVSASDVIPYVRELPDTRPQRYVTIYSKLRILGTKYYYFMETIEIVFWGLGHRNAG